MNKKTMAALIGTGLFAAGILAAVSLTLSLLALRPLLPNSPAGSALPASRHLIIYVPDSGGPFFSKMLEGATKAAREKNAALSIHTLDAAGRNLRMSAFLGSDGVAICPGLDDTALAAGLEQLSRKGVPFVMLNHGIPSDRPQPFVGTNNFDLGKKIGTALYRSSSVREVVAVIYSDKSPAIQAESELIEMGITRALGTHLSAPIIPLRTDLNPRDAERIVSSLLRETPRVTTLVFTDENDTLAGTQAVIDLNLVGRIRITGFGDSPAIRQLVDRGIILSSFDVNPTLIGYQGILSLFELSGSGYTSQSVDTGISVIARDKK